MKRFGGKYYEVKSLQNIPVDRLKQLEFVIHGHDLSDKLNDYQVLVARKHSGSYDAANLTVGILSFITPAGNPVTQSEDSGDGQNEFTFSAGNPGVLTMELSVRPSSIILGVRDEYYKSNDGCFRDCDHVERIRRANIRSEDGRSRY